MDSPEIRFAQRDDVNIAFFATGRPAPDIVFVPNWTSNIELFWEQGPFGRIIKPLASIGRVIAFDQPGTGISDPVALDELPTMEQWMDDVRIVMDAAGCERATLVAEGAAGPLAILFAATHPERTDGLVLLGSFARMMRDDGYPWGFPVDSLNKGIENWLAIWGTGRQLAISAPSVADDEQEVRVMGRAERHSASPGVARAYFRLIMELDVRHVLPAVRVPTLVIHRSGDRWIRIGHARYLADNIANAKLVEIPGEDHLFLYRDTATVIAEIQEFLTGVRAVPDDTERVLATFLFTDIVDSTLRATEMGDRLWRETLDAHDRVVRVLLERFRGREVKATGDGFLATFDGPARAVRCAVAIRDEARRIGLEIRAGLHTGECEVRGEDVGGVAVHVAARVLGLARDGEVLISQTVKDLTIGSGLDLADRGLQVLRGVPGEWRVFEVRT